MRDLLDALKSVSWKYYTTKKVGVHGSKNAGGAGIWNAFDAIKAVRYGPEWGTNVVWPDTKIFDDIKHGAAPGSLMGNAGCARIPTIQPSSANSCR